MVGFSIPYVADLNHDGSPEVIGIGQTDDGSTLSGGFRYVYIYNGRTGKELAKLPFITSAGAATGAFTSSGYHVSPSIAALVDSDKDGVVEIIVAFPSGGGASALQSKVVSYDIRPSGNTYTLEYRWESADKYIRNVAAETNGSSNFEKPNPQVVDLDGDGTPEVLVYNKVYNAVNGALLLELETMGTGTSSTTWPTAYLGSSVNATAGLDYDKYVAFPYIYDMNLDGIYDIVAGGKIYRIRTDGGGALPGRPGSGFSADKIELSGIGDGYTGVGDIDGDGKADVVVVSRAGTSGGIYNNSDIVVKAWTPNFNNGTASPKLIASRTIKFSEHISGAGDPGSGSYVFIGDIDGREQTHQGKTYRLPEIAVLTARISTTTGDLPRHPNVAGIPAGDSAGQGGIPTSMTSDRGALFALTFDPADETLKASFILEHQDKSINTGFTMFDFDNDGIQEICYRDMQTLRIIKPTIPYVKASYTTADYPDVIKFSRPCQSYTGFEYPVIADIDNDASAEMIVVGQNQGAYAYGYIYAVGNGDGDKFAPALPVWNQFMYDPFKINPDLTTPVGPAANRLSESFTFRRELKNENNEVYKTIDRYQPFNGTLIQAPYYMGLETTAGQPKDFEPIVFLTEAYITNNDDPIVADRPRITGTSSPYHIEITIGNRPTAKTDIPASMPLAVYENNRVSQATHVKKVLLSALEYWTGSAWAAFPATKSISHGEKVRLRIGITDPEDIYIVRLGDNSGTTPPETSWRWRWGLNDETSGTPNPNLGTGVASRQFRDCNWADQVVKVARNQLIDDTQTVQEYHTVSINVWENDILPDTYFSNWTIPHDSMKITMQPVAGTLAFSGSGRNSRIGYHHNGSQTLTNGIDSFRYQVSFWDASRNKTTQDAATVYIYVIESATHGFAACYGQETTITLANKPAGVGFDWYKAAGDTVIGHGRTRKAFFLADSVYRVHPIMPAGAFEHLDFPRGVLTVSLATPSSGEAVMRWTGLEDNNWKNPANWVEVKGSYETPVSWAPTGCVNVIIPSGATNYPELTDSAWCRRIVMKDRAMLKNPHVLRYAAASVEIKLTPAEKDRFILWSAPLRDMYSGDYHFKKTDGSPNWGDASMMFFQMPNPDVDGNTAVAHRMTATAGRPDAALPLGAAFNFRLAATSLNRDSTLRFPQTATSYTGADGTPYPTPSRTNKDRFIADVPNPDGAFDLPVKNNGGASPRILQVVNPYMAWLDAGQFIAANSASLQANAYLAWDGDVNTGIVSYYMASDAAGMRYWIPSAGTATGVAAGMIAPLKSFFVIRRADASLPQTLKMSPAWTTTRGAGVQNPYPLRAATSAPAPSLLYIEASQGGKTGSTLLRYDPQAIANYRDSEDVYQLFYDGTDGTDGVGLSLYSIAPWGEKLAVNSSGNFESRELPLGLRIRDAGEVRLDFSGLQTFGHDVWLTDKALGKETDLRKTSGYTFTVAKTGKQPLDISNRFSLRLRYTGKGLTGNESAPPSASLPQWTVASRDRYIHVQSTSDEIRDLQVYDVTGALVYRSQGLPATHFRLPVAQGIYIVRAQVGDTHQVEKVMVR